MKTNFKTINEALKSLNANLTKKWYNLDYDVEIEINGMKCWLQHGLRMDPTTDEQYEMFKNINDKKVNKYHIRLS